MKTGKSIILTTLFFVFLFGSFIYAQSDYERTQNFKTRYKQLEEAIKNAVSIDECNNIGDNITALKNEFTPYKALLDKSLYPTNFDSSFARINRELNIRKGDFTQIVDLKTEVGTLKDKISDISQQNVTLLSQIKELNIRTNKDAQTIASLEKLVNQLKANIAQRDELVRNIVDSLMAEFVKTPGSLNEAEKQSIFKQVDNGNLFYNVERTISDNVQFMKVTQMTPEDLSAMKKQYIDFSKVWRQVGPRLADVYMSKRDKAAEIANINGLFFSWNNRLNDEIWGQVNRLFRMKQLSILPFKSGEQFVSSVTSFVDDEIKNLPVKGSSQAEQTFKTFTDSVYFKTVEPVWIPLLVENNMMSPANKDTIEKRISMWKEKVAPASKMNWIYIIGGAAIVLLVAAYFLKGRKKVVVINEEKPE